MSKEKAKEMTLRELAAEAGVSERTIRFYISRGLVDPPLRGGRGAAYGEKHKARLEAIRALQAKGLMLAEIGHALAFEDAAKVRPGGFRCVTGELRKMTWFEPDGSMDKSEISLMAEAPDVERAPVSGPSLPEAETWRSYAIAPDVRVMLRTGAGPWRTKALISALCRFAAEVELESKKEDKGE
jgi:DNA-binding transcriptional MerR regulator